MTDGIVQVDCDRFDTTRLDQPDGTVVQRQRVDVPALGEVIDPLQLILVELRLHTVLMAAAFEFSEDLDRLRALIGDDICR